MYELKRISLHNWYLMDAMDIHINGHAAVIGPTGAGKSSVLDAIQTVMSGNNKNILELNAAAGEQRGRSVRDYCLGCVSDVNEGAPRRPRCETTLVLTFHDAGLNKTIAFGVMMTAEENQPESTRRFIAEDYDFEIENFIKSQKVATHNEIIDRVKADVGDRFKFYPNSARYVGAYLELMRPTMPPEPKRFLRAFSNALQAEKMKSPTDFVRRFVLEPMPLDVDGVRNSISVWKELVDEVERIRKMVTDLEVVNRNFEKGFQAKVRLTDLDVLEAELTLATGKLDVENFKNDIEREETKANEIAAQIAEYRQQLTDLQAEEEALKTSITANDIGAQMALIDAQAATASERRTALTKAVEDSLMKLRNLRFLERLGDAIPEAVALSEKAKKITQLTVDKVPEELALRADEIKTAAGSFSEKELQDVIASIRLQTEKITERRIMIASKLEEFGDPNEVSQPKPFSRGVTRFIEALKMAGIESQCLPDLVDVEDAGWAFALESLLGPNREAILVDERDSRAAFDILHRNRNEFDMVRLINLPKLRNARTNLAENTIADIVSTGNQDIRKFIDFNVGRYSKAETEDDLRRYHNAIMRNGKTSAGVTQRVFRDRATILGKRAQQRALEENKAERNRLAEEMKTIQQKVGIIESLVGHCRRAMEIDIDTLSENLNGLNEAVSNIRGFKQQKETLDAPDLRDAQRKLANVQEKLNTIKPELSALEEKKKQYDIKLGVFQERSVELTAKLPEMEVALAEASEAASSGLMQRLRDSITLETQPFPVTQEDIASLFEDDAGVSAVKASDLTKNLKEYSVAFRRQGEAEHFIKRGTNGLLSYAQKWDLRDAPLSEDDQDEDRFFWTQAQLRKNRDHELLKYEDRLTEAKKEMETSLKEGLISKLGEQFDLMEQQLDALNKRLARYTFVGQTYQFRSSVAAQFLPIYELVQLQREAGIEDELDLSDDRFAHLEELFQGEEKDNKMFEDYRQYFNYELWIEHPDKNDPERMVSSPFSEVVGKLSGGQRQAPYYVAIAASMVTSYYPKALPGDTEGMGLLVFDEAFNKLDIPNTQRLMELFRSLGLQVVVAAPEEKRPSLIECVDSMISVSRMPGGENVFVEDLVIGPRAKQAMLDENPVHQPMPA